MEEELNSIKLKSGLSSDSDTTLKIQELELSMAKLEKLKRLLELNIVSNEEYETKKQGLLNQL